MRALIISQEGTERDELWLGLDAVFPDAQVDMIDESNHALEGLDHTKDYSLVIIGQGSKQLTRTEIAQQVRVKMPKAAVWAYAPELNDEVAAGSGIRRVYGSTDPSSFRAYVQGLIDFRTNGNGNGIKPTNGH